MVPLREGSLRRREVCAGVAVLSPGDRLVPGTHITDQQARLYMHHRRTHTRQIAAARAGIGATTGARLDADPRLPSRRKAPRGRRRPDRLLSIWEAEIIPMLQATPGLRPVALFEEMLRRHPDLDPGIRLSWTFVNAPTPTHISTRSNSAGLQATSVRSRPGRVSNSTRTLSRRVGLPSW